MNTKHIQLVIEIYPRGGVIARYRDMDKPASKQSPSAVLFTKEEAFEAECRRLQLDLGCPLPEISQPFSGEATTIKRYELAATDMQLEAFGFSQKGSRK